MDDLYNELDRIAPLLDKLKKTSDARFYYHGVSDAIVWSDELPETEVVDELALRYLLHYRTSLLIENPIDSIEPYWNYGKNAFPNWPGFSPERCQPSRELQKEIEKFRKELDAFLEAEEE